MVHSSFQPIPVHSSSQSGRSLAKGQSTFSKKKKSCFSFHYNLLIPRIRPQCFFFIRTVLEKLSDIPHPTTDSEKEKKQLWKSHLTEFADWTQWSETVTTSACGGMLSFCLHAWAWVETRLNEAPLWDRHPSEMAAVCVSIKKMESMEARGN